jgi:hypothetical protein
MFIVRATGLESFLKQKSKHSTVQGTLTERKRLGTVDLLVLISLDQVILILANVIFSFTKQATLMRRSTVVSLPVQLVFPALSIDL